VERKGYDCVLKQGAGQRRGKSVTVFGNRVLERGEVRAECDGVLEQCVGERREEGSV